MVINWTNPAIQDLKYFRKNSQILDVDKYITNLIKNVNLLISQPKLGKIYFYTSGHIIRQFIHEKHRIFYYIDENIIHIIAIIHHSQDIKEKINYIKKYFNNE